VKVSTPSEEYDKSYHSNFETAELVDWAYQAKIAKFVFRAVAGLDDGLLPYRLEARVDDLVATVSKDELLAAGADAAIVARLAAAVEAFRTAAAAFDSRAGAIPPSAIESANGGLLEIERAVNAGFTALSPAEDDATVYPHQAVLKDVQGINAALAALRAAGPDPAAALMALEGTYLTRLGIVFSYPVYLKHIARLDPGFELITWGAQGQLPEPLDVIPECRKIQSGDIAGAIEGLDTKRAELTGELNQRLAGMASLLEQVTPRVKDLPGWR